MSEDQVSLPRESREEEEEGVHYIYGGTTGHFPASAKANYIAEQDFLVTFLLTPHPPRVLLRGAARLCEGRLCRSLEALHTCSVRLHRREGHESGCGAEPDHTS